MFSLWLAFLLWSRPVVPVVTWKSPKFYPVIELGFEITLGWCWRGSTLPPCLPLLHMWVLAAHSQCWLGPLFPVYDFLTPHNHGTLLLISCGSRSAGRLVRNGHWTPTRFLVQPARLPTVHRLIPSLLSWGSANKLCGPLPLLGLGC